MREASRGIVPSRQFYRTTQATKEGTARDINAVISNETFDFNFTDADSRLPVRESGIVGGFFRQLFPGFTGRAYFVAALALISSPGYYTATAIFRSSGERIRRVSRVFERNAGYLLAATSGH